MMTFGTEDAPIVPKPSVRTEEEEEEEVDRFEEVLGEIEERRQFLDDMASLGQDRPHRDRIMTEISQVLNCCILYDAYYSVEHPIEDFI